MSLQAWNFKPCKWKFIYTIWQNLLSDERTLLGIQLKNNTHGQFWRNDRSGPPCATYSETCTCVLGYSPSLPPLSQTIYSKCSPISHGFWFFYGSCSMQPGSERTCSLWWTLVRPCSRLNTWWVPAISGVYVCIQCRNEHYFHKWWQGSSQGDTESNSSIQVLLTDCIPSLVRAKLYSGSEDDISIILYNVVSCWWMSHWLMMIFGDVLSDPRTFQEVIDQCSRFAGRTRCISGKQRCPARSASMATPCPTLSRCARKPESQLDETLYRTWA